MCNQKEEFDKRMDAGIDYLIDDLLNSLKPEAEVINHNHSEESYLKSYHGFVAGAIWEKKIADELVKKLLNAIRASDIKLQSFRVKLKDKSSINEILINNGIAAANAEAYLKK